jgi:mannose-6-phosphate isomerase-like protein (cupin superfamily)
MQRLILILLTSVVINSCTAQNIRPSKIEPDSNSYENIFVKKYAEDEKQSTFIIWIKKEVKPHYHAHHTEYVQVISGKGTMILNQKEFKVKKGDAIYIPQGSIHSVTTTSRKPLKVMSVQAPKYDGDRVMVN